MNLQCVLHCQDVTDFLKKYNYVELDFLGYGMFKPFPGVHGMDDFLLPQLSSRHNSTKEYEHFDPDMKDRLRLATVTSKFRPESKKADTDLKKLEVY